MSKMSLEKERKRPLNVAAERAVLAGLIQYGNKVYADVSEILSIDCFTVTENGQLFNIAKSILEHSDRIDMASLLSTASSLGYQDFTAKKDLGDYVKALFTFSINSESVRKNAVILKKLQIARKAQDVSRDIWYELGNITGNESIGQIITKIEGPILGMDFGSDSSEDRTIKLSDIADETLDYFENMNGKINGVISPFTRYNKCIGGCRRPGYVYLIGARPKSGKSQIAIFDALYVALQLGIPVLYIDTEMQPIDTMARIYASMANVPFNDIETGSFKLQSHTKNKVYEARDKFKKSGMLSYRKVSGKPFDEIVSIIRKWVVQDVGLENGKAKPCLLIYDYFKLMDSSDLGNMQEYQALGFQVSGLTDFCGKYGIPCSAFVQLNRNGVENETSSAISQSDRLLWMCASFALLKRKTDDEIALDGPENGNAKLIPTTDQRFGPGLSEGDWINLDVRYDRCIFTEGLTRKEIKKNKPRDSGFETIDDAEPVDDGFSDDDFDSAAKGYKDNQYRKN
jgi:replicative DNA helicase